MAINLVVQHKNKRHNMRAGPMKPLGYVLEELCQKLRPRVEPKTCQLLLKGEPLDLSIPLRLMNLPSGAKLELVSSAEPGQRPSTAPAAHNPSHDPLERGGPDARDSGTQSAPTTSDVQTKGPSMSTNARQAQSARGISAEAAASGNECDSSNPTTVSAIDGQGSSKDHDIEIEREWRRDDWSSLASVGRKFYLFRRDALMEGASSGKDEDDIPDDYYDFTAEDYHRVMKEHQEKVAFEEAGLRTRALREFAELAKTQALGPVNIRLFFPTGEVCQTEFHATDSIGDVYDFASRLVKGGQGCFVLYTTPPRVDLKDETVTLYKAQLIPAANVHIALSKASKKGKRKVADENAPEMVELRDDVKACLMEKPPSRQDSAQPHEKSENTTGSDADKMPIRPTVQAPAKPKKGIPKWMKL